MTPWTYLNPLNCTFFLRFYLFMRDRQRHRQREKQAPCREPSVRLYPGTLGPHPEPKADAHPLSHAAASILILKWIIRNL